MDKKIDSLKQQFLETHPRSNLKDPMDGGGSFQQMLGPSFGRDAFELLLEIERLLESSEDDSSKVNSIRSVINQRLGISTAQEKKDIQKVLACLDQDEEEDRDFGEE